MSNARIQFSLASEDVWNAYNPQLKEGEIVTVLKANKKVKLVQGKVGGSTYSDSTLIWDEDTAETTMSRAEAAAVTATAQANAASGSASKAAASQAAAATSATNAKASENAAANSETNVKASATAAKNSATSAASYASIASTQAGKAADSATAAAGSAAQAGTFATTATDKATAADKSATAADKRATAAAASAVTASDKASEAATSATNAAVSATSAAGAAAEAQGLISKAEYGFLQRNTAYKVGDIAYTTQLPAGYYLECVTAGTTGNTEPSISVESENVNDGTVKWGVKNIQTDVAAIAQGLTRVENKLNEAAIVGTVIPYAGTSLPTGYLPCNGAAVSRETYASLFAVIGTTYGSGDGSTTFNLPNLENNSFMEFSSSVGTAKSAGLPNITGEAGNPTTEGTSAISSSGALTATIIASGRAAGSGGSSMKISIDASKSSSIYGNSTTVQPKSLTVRAIIKY